MTEENPLNGVEEYALASGRRRTMVMPESPRITSTDGSSDTRLCVCVCVCVWMSKCVLVLRGRLGVCLRKAVFGFE